MKYPLLLLLITATTFLGLQVTCGTDTGPGDSSIDWGNPTISGPITAHFGCANGDGGDNKCRSGHQGIDIGVPTGTEVFAAANGTVSGVDEFGGGSSGIWISIDHKNGWVSSYWHLQRIEDGLRAGVDVSKGQLIAFSDNTGNSSGPHLHFNIQHNGAYVNPLNYIPGYSDDLAKNVCGERIDGFSCGPNCTTCPARVLPPVPPSGGGGLESAPLWLWRNAKEANSVQRQNASVVPPLWKWANKSTTQDQKKASASQGSASSYSISLDGLMPAPPAGITRILTQPKDVIGNSNALESLGADYVDTSTSNDTASIVAFRTAGSVYAHDYAVCSRFKNGYLTSLKPVDVSKEIGAASPVYFWGAHMQRITDGVPSEEYVTTFAVYVSDDEKSFTVDSNWISDEYVNANGGYILTFQVWANDPTTAGRLGNNILQTLASRGTLNFRNTQTPATPGVFIVSADYAYGQATLTMFNATQASRDVDFTAIVWSASVPESEAQSSFKRSIAPGLSSIQLPLPRLLSSVIYTNDGGGFVDKVYVTDGAWSAFTDSGIGSNSSVNLTFSNCAKATNLTARDQLVAGCAAMSGTVSNSGWAGILRALNTPSRPVVNVNQKRALTFFASGDGKSYRVSINTDSVSRLNSTDFHQFVFTAPPEGKQFVIPFTYFSQQGWDSSKVIPFTSEDVTGLAWSSVGAPLDSINLSVDKIAFTNSTIISEVTALPDTSNVAGPYTVRARITDDVALSTAFLIYSIDGGLSFTRVPMTASGNDLYSGSIPGQPLGTGVKYYVEATDADGNTATNPPDVPYTTYRFQISDHPYLLVDDFVDTNPVNMLGGNPFLFGAESGGAITTHYDKESLKLVYDVSAPNSFAGYSTPLKHANLSSYSSVTFLIKGASGGEKVKVGLRDSSGNEVKIPLSDYLSGGITTSWQKIAIPLKAFAGVTKWSDMESFVVALENTMGSGRGAIFVDDIKFESLIDPLPNSVPLLLTEGDTLHAIALDSVTLVRDPFPVNSLSNLSSDHRTRVAIFSTNLFLLPTGATSVTAQAEDSQHRVFPLTVEYVGRVPMQNWITQVVVKLPDELRGAGDVWISITINGTPSNRAFITVQ